MKHTNDGDTTGGQTEQWVDPDEQRIYEKTHAKSIEDQRMASEPTTLRKDVTVRKRAKPVGQTTDEFTEYVRRCKASADTHESERGVRWENHAYSHAAACERFAKTLDVDRAARRLWGDDLTTVMLVRRATSYGKDGQPQPPADHLDDLVGGNDAVYQAMRRQLDDTLDVEAYCRVSVLEPHRDGYAHIHDGLWIHDTDGQVCRSAFEPVVDAHLNAVSTAKAKNHGLSDAVSVEQSPPSVTYPNDPADAPPSTGLPRELTKFLGGFMPYDGERNEYTPPVLQAERGRLRFFSLLWARSASQWRHSDSDVWERLLNAARELWRDSDGYDDADTTPDESTVGDGVDTITVDACPVDFSRATGD